MRAKRTRLIVYGEREREREIRRTGVDSLPGLGESSAGSGTGQLSTTVQPPTSFLPLSLSFSFSPFAGLYRPFTVCLCSPCGRCVLDRCEAGTPNHSHVCVRVCVCLWACSDCEDPSVDGAWHKGRVVSACCSRPSRGTLALFAPACRHNRRTTRVCADPLRQSIQPQPPYPSQESWQCHKWYSRDSR